MVEANKETLWFSQQCARLAKNASAWAADSLDLPDLPANSDMMARFLNEMRERLNYMEERMARTTILDVDG